MFVGLGAAGARRFQNVDAARMREAEPLEMFACEQKETGNNGRGDKWRIFA